MPALTRRRAPDNAECWNVYYGDVMVGSIGIRAGVPVDVDQWGWSVGFYPASHRYIGMQTGGTAETFEAARAGFEEEWRTYLPLCTPADFAESRRRTAYIAWLYRMHDTGTLLPTQMASGRSRCFCGAEMTIASVDQHIAEAHTPEPQDA